MGKPGNEEVPPKQEVQEQTLTEILRLKKTHASSDMKWYSGESQISFLFRAARHTEMSFPERLLTHPK